MKYCPCCSANSISCNCLPGIIARKVVKWTRENPHCNPSYQRERLTRQIQRVLSRAGGRPADASFKQNQAGKEGDATCLGRLTTLTTSGAAATSNPKAAAAPSPVSGVAGEEEEGEAQD